MGYKSQTRLQWPPFARLIIHPTIKSASFVNGRQIQCDENFTRLKGKTWSIHIHLVYNCWWSWHIWGPFMEAKSNNTMATLSVMQNIFMRITGNINNRWSLDLCIMLDLLTCKWRKWQDGHHMWIRGWGSSGLPPSDRTKGHHWTFTALCKCRLHA